MKVVIIGGGIAGLTLGILLNRKNIDVVINERSIGIPSKGHAFLMHSDGLAILNDLANDHNAILPGENIETFSLRRPEGNEIKHVELSAWQCIKRGDLIRFLYSLLPADKIKEGRKFSHFIYKNEKTIAAAFLNGEVEYGDIFVGADGGNSSVREAMIGKVDLTPVNVKEIVGIAHNEEVAKTYARIFTKFQHKANGLAFGLIPTSGIEFVWFMQYDPSVADLTNCDSAEIKSFCKSQLDNFPPVVSQILGSNDFETSYVWNTCDFDLLSSFHKQNVVLIGDAAHLALPFTSSGTTNAVIDAKILAESLEKHCEDYEKAFNHYYELRAGEILKHIELGRELKNLFLNPQNRKDQDILIPLTTFTENVKKKKEAKRKVIDVLYFTDPICSTCWIIEPILRKLKLEYGKYLNFEYRMGGLLPSWNDYNAGKINKPVDAAQHWEDVSAYYQTPLDGDVWIDDPLTSSYPPSIAFKAAQMQDKAKALLFLRRIKEMVFIEKKNIIKWEYLEQAAFESGLNTTQFLFDYEGEAEQHFLEDLKLAEKYGVTTFPTFFFSDPKDNNFKIKGYQSYDKFESLILQLIPGAKKKEINLSGGKLFNYFKTMTDKEFAYLSDNVNETSTKILTELLDKNNIERYVSKNGNIWKHKAQPIFKRPIVSAFEKDVKILAAF